MLKLYQATRSKWVPFTGFSNKSASDKTLWEKRAWTINRRTWW